MIFFFIYQSGFRSKHSANTCLAHLSSQILKGFEARKSTGTILIDHQKAFDILILTFFWRSWNILGFHQKLLNGLNPTPKNEILFKPCQKPLRTWSFKLWSLWRVHFGSYTLLLHLNDMKSAVNDCDLRLHAMKMLAQLENT